jgi:hypothetical protein
MASIRLDVPDDLLEKLGGIPDAVGREILLAAAFYWCRRGDLSTSQAAQLAEMTDAGFLEAAVQRQAVLYDYEIDEINAELSRPFPERVHLGAIKEDVARAQAARG